jgi:hypothetical protein
MKKVTREQFQTEVKVTHIPTGAWFTAGYENMGRAGDVLENGDDYSPNEVRAMAAHLLREHEKNRPA